MWFTARKVNVIEPSVGAGTHTVGSGNLFQLSLYASSRLFWPGTGPNANLVDKTITPLLLVRNKSTFSKTLSQKHLNPKHCYENWAFLHTFRLLSLMVIRNCLHSIK
jgi:hypothetical protein